MSLRNPTHQKIGLVLSSIPSYSETFFRNKVAGLLNEGFDVMLLIDKPISKNSSTFPFRVVSAPDFRGNTFYRILKGLKVLLAALILHPGKSYKYFVLCKRQSSLSASLINVIRNQFILNQKLDWIHYGFGMLAVGREDVAEAIGAKMAVSFRGFDLYLSPLKHPNCYFSLFKRNVKYHVLAEEMVETLVAKGIDKTTIVKIPPAIDVQFFSGTVDRVFENPIRLITVARLHWKKGLEYTLEAIALLKQAGILVKYTIIGAGSERERLVFAAHQLGILELVDFKGQVSQQEVKTCLEQSDIYIQYSIQEGFCNAVLEAQAMGVLCVVSNAEGLSENVLDTKTGWVLAKRNPSLLAKKIIEIINLPEVAKNEIRRSAMARVRQQFNLKQQIQAFVDFYEM
ncbi:glycosyltransferase family 4 protein [Seonamhaeicola maritimus]|uniref:glycosyltransferase family 4 protein n=1 Tax=Seonamhaeicola maritimus TaxID=2591822 RepID=UPI002494694A|nr:glycosyltransferase family 4 protein [Seonamhaeicola maritimus]